MSKIIDLLGQYGIQAKKKTAKESASKCPFCGGVDRFCIWPEEDRYWCRQCNVKGDAIQFFRDLDGMTFQEASEAVGKPVKPKKATKKKSTIVDTYDYVDIDGSLLFQVVRSDPKSFWQRRPGKKTKWLNNLQGVKRVLYKLPELVDKSAVLFVEGEKDVNELLRLGIPATTNPMGANKLVKQQSDYSILEPLRGKSVFVIPDNDDPGKQHAEQLATLLQGIAKTIKVIELPGLAIGGDVSDFILDEGDEEAKNKLRSYALKAAVWTPPSNFFSITDLLNTQFENHIPVIEKGIMPWGSHVIIAGESGVGKSLLRMELSIHLMMGWDWLGFHVPKARKVTVFQYENSEPMEKSRFMKMVRGLNIANVPQNSMSYVDRRNRINLSIKGDRAKLLELVKESEGEVIIYDCLSNLHSGKENDNIQMRDVLDSLTEINAKIGTSCILIHHFGKPSEVASKNAYRTRGASSIMDWAVTAMAYTAKKHESKVLRQLEFTKVRDGPIPKPFLLERDEDFLLKIIHEDTMCPPHEVKEVLEDLGGSVNKQNILLNAIMEHAGCSNRSAKSFIHRAVELGEISERYAGPGKPKGYYISMANL